MSVWEKAIEFVLAYEGGWVCDINDPGGETNFGISKKAYPNEDIKAMTAERAKEIYKKDYWDLIGCSQLPGKWAVAVFDTAVNMGQKKAVRLLQSALQVTADGIIGSVTISATHKSSEIAIAKFLALRAAEYVRIMDRLEGLKVYSFNWMFRLFKLANIVLEGEGLELKEPSA